MLIEQGSDFRKLDATLQGFVEARIQNHTALDQLIHRNSVAAKAHIDNRIDALNQSLNFSISSASNRLEDNLSSAIKEAAVKQIEKGKCETLLDSFRHEVLNNRRNQIKDNYSDTFSWIFNAGHNEKSTGYEV